jgi:hypothetical protein
MHLVLLATAITHQFLFPTGRLTPPGEISIAQHEACVLFEGRFGVTDSLDITFAMPPGPMLGGLQARVGLLGRDNPARLAIGAGVGWWLLEDPTGVWIASATGGMPVGPIDVHGSVMAFKSASGPSGLGVASAGITVPGRSVSFMADIGRFSVLAGRDFGALTALAVGVKFGNKKFMVDLGLLVTSELPPLPLVTFTHRVR